MVSSIKSRKVPATLAIIPTIFPGLYGGNYKKVATFPLVDESLLVIRPDHIIAWRVSKMSMLDSNILDEAVSKITGVDQNGKSLYGNFCASSDANTIACYQRWLTREFKVSLRPYRFKFPKSIPVDNLIKEIAISIAKAKMKSGLQFMTTTKQDNERTRVDI